MRGDAGAKASAAATAVVAAGLACLLAPYPAAAVGGVAVSEWKDGIASFYGGEPGKCRTERPARRARCGARGDGAAPSRLAAPSPLLLSLELLPHPPQTGWTPIAQVTGPLSGRAATGRVARADRRGRAWARQTRSIAGPSPPSASQYLSRSEWPYWSVGALATSNPFHKELPTEACGACFEVECVDRHPMEGRCNGDPSARSTQIVVTDKCPECAPDHIDLQARVFERIARSPSVGRVAIRFRRVACEPPGDLTIRADAVSGGGWTRLTAMNVRGAGPVASVVAEGGGRSVELANTWGAAWETGAAPPLPLSLRLTDERGARIECPDVVPSGGGAGDWQAAGQNFPPWVGEGGGSPESHTFDLSSVWESAGRGSGGGRDGEGGGGERGGWSGERGNPFASGGFVSRLEETFGPRGATPLEEGGAATGAPPGSVEAEGDDDGGGGDGDGDGGGGDGDGDGGGGDGDGDGGGGDGVAAALAALAAGAPSEPDPAPPRATDDDRAFDRDVFFSTPAWRPALEVCADPTGWDGCEPPGAFRARARGALHSFFGDVVAGRVVPSAAATNRTFGGARWFPGSGAAVAAGAMTAWRRGAGERAEAGGGGAGGGAPLAALRSPSSPDLSSVVAGGGGGRGGAGLRGRGAPAGTAGGWPGPLKRAVAPVFASLGRDRGGGDDGAAPEAGDARDGAELSSDRRSAAAVVVEGGLVTDLVPPPRPPEGVSDGDDPPRAGARDAPPAGAGAGDGADPPAGGWSDWAAVPADALGWERPTGVDGLVVEARGRGGGAVRGALRGWAGGFWSDALAASGGGARGGGGADGDGVARLRARLEEGLWGGAGSTVLTPTAPGRARPAAADAADAADRSSAASPRLVGSVLDVLRAEGRSHFLRLLDRCPWLGGLLGGGEGGGGEGGGGAGGVGGPPPWAGVTVLCPPEEEVGALLARLDAGGGRAQGVWGEGSTGAAAPSASPSPPAGGGTGGGAPLPSPLSLRRVVDAVCGSHILTERLSVPALAAAGGARSLEGGWIVASGAPHGAGPTSSFVVGGRRVTSGDAGLGAPDGVVHFVSGRGRRGGMWAPPSAPAGLSPPARSDRSISLPPFAPNAGLSTSRGAERAGGARWGGPRWADRWRGQQ